MNPCSGPSSPPAVVDQALVVAMTSVSQGDDVTVETESCTIPIIQHADNETLPNPSISKATDSFAEVFFQNMQRFSTAPTVEDTDPLEASATVGGSTVVEQAIQDTPVGHTLIPTALETPVMAETNMSTNKKKRTRPRSSYGTKKGYAKKKKTAAFPKTIMGAAWNQVSISNTPVASQSGQVTHQSTAASLNVGTNNSRRGYAAIRNREAQIRAREAKDGLDQSHLAHYMTLQDAHTQIEYVVPINVLPEYVLHQLANVQRNENGQYDPFTFETTTPAGIFLYASFLTFHSIHPCILDGWVRTVQDHPKLENNGWLKWDRVKRVKKSWKNMLSAGLDLAEEIDDDSFKAVVVQEMTNSDTS